MIRKVKLIGIALSLSACADSVPQHSTAQDNAARMTRLENRVDGLESRAEELESQLTQMQSAQPPTDSRVMSENRAVAVLTGSTRDGSPIETEFSSMERCMAARAALLTEGERVCAGRNPEDSTSSIIYSYCSKPQASCSLK